MNSISFLDVSLQCKNIVENSKIKNATFGSIIQKMYSKFSFYYFNFQSFQNEKKNDFLTEKLNEYKFLAYKYSKIPESIRFFPQKAENNMNIQPGLADVIICSENNFFIIEQIDKELVENILKKSESVSININQLFDEIISDTSITEELTNFCKHFQLDIKNNEFIKYTIETIFVYLIRRFYYPSTFFKDPSFFRIEDSDFNTNDQMIKDNIINIFQENNQKEFKSKIDEFQNLLKTKSEMNDELAYKEKYFEEKDFIRLRDIHSDSDKLIYLGLHMKSLHIFILKKICPSIANEQKKEIDFCKKIHHRCFTRFYNFLKEEDEITGFVYEFMSNGSLPQFYKKHLNKINNFFSLIAMIRIFKGIEYLHSQHYFNLDLKPSNILLDHDFIPYISDFESIRSIDNTENSMKFGSILYASPEKFNSSDVSYETDIYSFGTLIYFLFEKKDMFNIDKEYSDQIYKKIEKGQIPEMKNASKNINELYVSSVKYDPKVRIKLGEIHDRISNEINSFLYFEKFLNEENNKIPNEIIQYILESVRFQIANDIQFNNYTKMIFNHRILSLFLFRNTKSNLFFQLGKIYLKGRYIKQDYEKARKYLELSAEYTNSDALLLLGNIFQNGLGVPQDSIKAEEYYIKSSKQHNSKAYLELGMLYFYGKGVE